MAANLSAEFRGQAQRLRAIVPGLSNRQAQCLVLRCLYTLSIKEISNRLGLGISNSTVNQHLRKAILKLGLRPGLGASAQAAYKLGQLLPSVDFAVSGQRPPQKSPA